VGIEMVGEVLPYAISSLLQTQVGRNVVRNAFARGGGQLTREGMGEILHAVGLGAVTQAVAP